MPLPTCHFNKHSMLMRLHQPFGTVCAHRITCHMQSFNRRRGVMDFALTGLKLCWFSNCVYLLLVKSKRACLCRAHMARASISVKRASLKISSRSQLGWRQQTQKPKHLAVTSRARAPSVPTCFLSPKTTHGIPLRDGHPGSPR